MYRTLTYSCTGYAYTYTTHWSSTPPGWPDGQNFLLYANVYGTYACHGAYRFCSVTCLRSLQVALHLGQLSLSSGLRRMHEGLQLNSHRSSSPVPGVPVPGVPVPPVIGVPVAGPSVVWACTAKNSAVPIAGWVRYIEVGVSLHHGTY